MADGETTGSPPGAWLSISAAARALGITPRAVRGRIKHNTIEWRPKGNGGREVFVPATGSLPRASQGSTALTLALPGPAVVPIAELDALRVELVGERQRREGLEQELTGVCVELAVARRELELERERTGELRASLATAEAALVELRRPWLARLVGQVRDALRR